MNLVAGSAGASGVLLPGGVDAAALRCLRTRSETLTVGVRAGALRVHAREGDLALPGRVELAEISGSDTFVHVRTSIGELVAQLTGVHVFSLGAAVTLYLNPAESYVFDAAGDLLVAPAAHPRQRSAEMARIELDLAHAYAPNPQRDEDYALLPLEDGLRRRRCVCAARPFRLRQDHAAEHRIGPRETFARPA